MAASPPVDDREGWIRVKLQAGLPLDDEERAYLATLPPGDPLLLARPVPRTDPPGVEEAAATFLPAEPPSAAHVRRPPTLPSASGSP